MKLKAASFAASLAVAAALLAAGQAQAQVTLTLQPGSLTIAPGQTVVVTGTIQNFGPDPVFLNGDLFGGSTPAGLTFDDSPFISNAPSELLSSGDAGDTYTGALFDITLAPDASGIYTGSFSLIGGADANADSSNDVLATAPIQVTAVPEPSSIALLSIGGLLLGGLAFAGRKVRQA